VLQIDTRLCVSIKKPGLFTDTRPVLFILSAVFPALSHETSSHPFPSMSLFLVNWQLIIVTSQGRGAVLARNVSSLI
jgi:hypothetical protein